LIFHALELGPIIRIEVQEINLPFMKVSFKIQLLDKMETEDTFNSMPDYVDLVNLVRSIQRAEGNPDCYHRGRQQCDRLNCVWRDHCLEAPLGGLVANYRNTK
jgi:hypothetical protein